MTGTIIGFRGIGNRLWSDGIDTLVSQLVRLFGWRGKVFRHASIREAQDWLAANDTGGPLVLIGHSMGVNSADRLSDLLDRTVNLFVSVDSAWPEVMAPNVYRVLSVTAESRGRFNVKGGKVNKSIVIPDTTHTTVDDAIALKNEVMEQMLKLTDRPAPVAAPITDQASRQWTHHLFDRAIFFDAVRRHPFDGQLSQGQVNGMNALLDTWEARFIEWDMRELAYNLATAWWETGRTMQPVEENGDRDYFLRYDIGGNARKARELGNTQPGDGWRFRGMGHVQSTGRANARRQSIELRRFGIHIDLEAEPDRRLQDDVSILSLFVGNHEGWWTGRRLPNFAGYGNWDMRGARTVVNGTDRWAEIGEVAGYFLDALNAAAVPQRLHDSDFPLPAPTPPENLPGAPAPNVDVLTPEAIADLSADELIDLIRRADALRDTAMDALEARIGELKSNQMALREVQAIDMKGLKMTFDFLKPNSKTFWAGVISAAAGIVMLVLPADSMLVELARSFYANADPGTLITVGLGLIFGREAISKNGNGA